MDEWLKFNGSEAPRQGVNYWVSNGAVVSISKYYIENSPNGFNGWQSAWPVTHYMEIKPPLPPTD